MLNDINLFSDNIKDTFLFHIPHSSTFIPNKAMFNPNINLDKELLLSTDHCTNDIFDVKNTKKFTNSISRLFCDVERFVINEPMDNFGRGMFYTKTVNDDILREFNHYDYNKILEEYFLPYHKNLTNVIGDILNKNNIVHIVDCHSFNENRLRYEPIGNRPDICLGVDEFHTPKYLIDFFKLHFEKNGFSVEINSPYVGTFVPLKYYQTNPNVKSIMIEINKRLYMTNDTIINNKKVMELKRIINDLFVF